MYPSTALISISAASLLLVCEQRAALPGADSHPSPPRAEARAQPDDPRLECPPESRQRRTEDRRTVAVGCLDAQGLLHGPGRRWTAGQLIWDETALHGKREGLRKIWNEAVRAWDDKGRRISVKDPEEFFPTPFQLRWKEQER